MTTPHAFDALFAASSPAPADVSAPSAETRSNSAPSPAKPGDRAAAFFGSQISAPDSVHSADPSVATDAPKNSETSPEVKLDSPSTSPADDKTATADRSGVQKRIDTLTKQKKDLERTSAIQLAERDKAIQYLQKDLAEARAKLAEDPIVAENRRLRREKEVADWKRDNVRSVEEKIEKTYQQESIKQEASAIVSVIRSVAESYGDLVSPKDIAYEMHSTDGLTPQQAAERVAQRRLAAAQKRLPTAPTSVGRSGHTTQSPPVRPAPGERAARFFAAEAAAKTGRV